MNETKLIGQFLGEFPYEVSLVLDADSDKFIELAEGRGSRVFSAGHFSLTDMLRESWDTHLEKCDALWLREIARLNPLAGVKDVLAEYEKRKLAANESEPT